VFFGARELDHAGRWRGFVERSGSSGWWSRTEDVLRLTCQPSWSGNGVMMVVACYMECSDGAWERRQGSSLKYSNFVEALSQEGKHLFLQQFYFSMMFSLFQNKRLAWMYTSATLWARASAVHSLHTTSVSVDSIGPSMDLHTTEAKQASCMPN
jgi:hypothetical protein